MTAKESFEIFKSAYLARVEERSKKFEEMMKKFGSYRNYAAFQAWERTVSEVEVQELLSSLA